MGGGGGGGYTRNMYVSNIYVGDIPGICIPVNQTTVYLNYKQVITDLI